LFCSRPAVVDDQHVDRLRAGRLQGLEGERGGVRALAARHHRAAGALAPDLELLDRGGPESVARRQHDLAALGAESGGELPDRGGLARSVDADHQDHEGAGGRIDHQRPRDRHQDLLDLGGEDLFHLVGRHRRVVTADPDRGRDLGGGRDAEVGADQQLLELLDRAGVELALADEVGDGAADRRGRPPQPGREPAPPARFRRGILIGAVIHVGGRDTA